MKHLITRLGAMLLALCLLCSLVPAALAATVDNAAIDQGADCSLTLYKYDITAAEADGFVPGSYVSTGQADSGAEAALAPYAIEGVEFTFLKVAELTTYSYQEAGGYKVQNLYRFPNDSTTSSFLSALGLTRANAYREVNGQLDFVPEVVQTALAHKLADNATTVKNALEALAVSTGTAMPVTSETGRSHVEGLTVGLYLLVETRLPEQVTCTTDPFLVSLPMTTVDGSQWNYDVVVYPKNQTGEPTLEKTLRESKPDTGKHDGTTDDITDGYAHTGTASEGDTVEYQIISTLPVVTSDATALTTYTFVDMLSKGLTYNKGDVVLEFFTDTGKHDGATDDITDGYAHTGTASEGDILEYQIISTLPVITSDATALTTYTFVDTLSKGLTYNRGDVQVEWFRDASCTDKITAWTEDSGKFAVVYGGGAMEISMTEEGLAEINSGVAVHGAASTERGYSRCTLRITYACTLDSSADTVLGDNGNPNTVTLTWRRTNREYYNTLTDDAHAYTYGLALTKLFSDGKGDPSQVEFIIHNDTDGYFVKAELHEGVYYMTDHVEEERDATHFIPVSDTGKIIVKGWEDDTYTLTEVHTDSRYTLLERAVTVEISTRGNGHICPVCGEEGVTATAKVNGDPVAMAEDNGSVAALAPFEIKNNRGPEIPKTGDNTMLSALAAAALLSLCGMLLVSGYLLRNGKKAWKK